MNHDLGAERIHETWLHSDRTVPTRFVRPLLQFVHIEAASGIALLFAAVAALVWANAPFGDTYERFWHTHLSIELGGFHFDESLKHLVNDALMAIFFFVVGLEIKRELVEGDLRDPRKAALPAVAALGGMIVPALVFLAFTIGDGDAAGGWGIPMATDIAFSVGVISLLGRRVPIGAKLFLLALAIADDIGAIVVIAVFYSSDLATGWLLAGVAGLGLIYVAGKVGVRNLGFYAVAALAVWFMMLESGVHATLAGVALAFLTPAAAWYSDAQFLDRSRRVTAELGHPSARHSPERIDDAALQLSAVARESVSPLARLERQLHPWSSFVVIPLFALANAGVRFAGVDAGELVSHPVAFGVAAGLVVGKLVGITAATWVAVRTGIGRLPENATWRHVVGIAALAGIGFTVSLFIAELAFADAILVDAAKLGIFAGSAVAGTVGALVLSRSAVAEEAVEVAERTEEPKPAFAIAGS